MKIAFATALLALPAVFGLTKINQKTLNAIQKANLKQVPRQLADAVDEYDFLTNYEQVYVTCDASAVTTDAYGQTEYGTVMYRLCPTGAACGKDGLSCKSGYGDYVVGMQTYMQAYLDQFDQENQENADAQFDFKEFGECRKYDIEQEQEYDESGAAVAASQYYIGPICSEGDIRIAFFKGDANNANADQCVAANESSDFQTLTGFQLPWSSSILEDDKCKSYYCSTADENGGTEYNAFCTGLYAVASSKCETKMASPPATGVDETGCETTSAMMAATSNGGGAGGWIFFSLLVACVAGFGVWYFLNEKKKKSGIESEGLMM